MFKQTSAAALALLLAAGCGSQTDPQRGRGGKGDDGFGNQIDAQTETFAYRYALNPACLGSGSRKVCPGALTAAQLGDATRCPPDLMPFSRADGTLICQIVGGQHQVYIPDTGREQIDSQNQPRRLHPDLEGTYQQHDSTLEQCAGMPSDPELCAGGVDHVFASQWWPQSENGIAWRWAGSGGYEDLSDPRGFSPAEKVDLMFGQSATYCPDGEITVSGKTFCAQKVRCGTNRCEKSDGTEVSCSSDEAAYCINYSWKQTQDGCPDEGENCTPQKHPMVKVLGPATKWELERHGKYQRVSPDNWWGHCNGWASYATAEALGYPKRDICVKLVAGKVTLCASDFGADGQATGETAKCGTTAATQGCTLFRMGDMEALMTELYFNDASTFSGRRCDLLPEDLKYDEYGRPEQVACRDINAGTFHVAVTGLLGKGVTPFEGGAKKKLSFVIDHNYDFEVWNFPLQRYEFVKVTEIAADGSNCPVQLPASLEQSAKACAAQLVAAGANGDYSKFNPHSDTTRFVAVKMNYWMVSDGVSAYDMRKRADLRGDPTHQSEMNYVLELDSRGKILGGEWTSDATYSWGDDNKKAHPDFLWMGIKPSADGDPTDRSDDDNPYVNYQQVKQLMQCSNDPSTCGGTGGGGTGGGSANICQGHCGDSVTVSGSTCYCDEVCHEQDPADCCTDDAGTPGASRAYVDDVCSF